MKYLTLIMLVSTLGFGAEELRELQQWNSYSMKENSYKNALCFEDSHGFQQNVKVSWSSRSSSSSFASLGKKKHKATVAFRHPSTGQKMKLVFRGRSFSVGGLSMVGQKKPTTMELKAGKERLAYLTFHFDDQLVFSGDLAGQNLQIVADDERVFVENGFLQRTLFRFIPCGRYRLKLDGEVVGFLENYLDENDTIQLELTADLGEATRGHLMASAMGFMMMSDFLDQLN